MSDAAIFVLIFGGLFVLRIAAATLVFWWILPSGDRCPNCDAPTLRVQATGFNRLMRGFRPSWCYACGWVGLLRNGEPTPSGAASHGAPSTAPRKGQPPRGADSGDSADSGGGGAGKPDSAPARRPPA